MKRRDVLVGAVAIAVVAPAVAEPFSTDDMTYKVYRRIGEVVFRYEPDAQRHELLWRDYYWYVGDWRLAELDCDIDHYVANYWHRGAMTAMGVTPEDVLDHMYGVKI